jgi:branched-subunit amino acid aminotransferase/4-amino-4-deoxychorismate lyase
MIEFTMNYQVPLAYLNEQFLPQSQAKLALNDAGFVMGATVTDLCRTFHHRPFLLPEHLVRFRASCALAEIPQPKTDNDLTEIACCLVKNNVRLIADKQDLAIVFFATPGPIGYYFGEPGSAGEGKPTLGVHTFPLPFSRYASWFERGASLVILKIVQLSRDCVDPAIKHRSRLHWWLADRQVKQTSPGSQALLLDGSGNITETAAANFLIVLDGAVISPPRDSILGGISLRFVEELCGQLVIPFVRRAITVEDCKACDEALLCGTAFCLAGVREIDGAPLPWPGPILGRLLQAWSDRVGLDIGRQFLANR